MPVRPPAGGSTSSRTWAGPRPWRAPRAAGAVLTSRTDPDWGRHAREAAGGRLDLVVDVGGAATLEASLRAARPGGPRALVGVRGGAAATIPLPLAVMRQVRLQGVTCGDREAFEAML